MLFIYDFIDAIRFHVPKNKKKIILTNFTAMNTLVIQHN